MGPTTYLDCAATTPLDPRVRAAMDAAAGVTGNPSSTHAPGREARAVVDKARSQVAALLGVPAGEVVFTSGATEANGMAVRAVLRAVRASRPGAAPRIVSSSIEHSSLAGTIEAARADGEASVALVAPGRDGVVRAEDVASAIDADTVLVCVMWANNVLGTVQPVEAVGRAVVEERARRGPDGLPIVFLCDAVQAAPSIAVDARAVDVLVLSAHKMYGPKGAGAMRLAPGAPFSPVYGGGGQENGRRHGTENVAGIAGFGEAAALLAAERDANAKRLAGLRGLLLDRLSATAPRANVVGAAGIPGTVFLRVPGERGDELALKLDAAGFAVSAGSACDAGTRRAPRTLSAVLDEQAALAGGVRVSFGRFTKDDDLMRFADALGRIIKTPR